MSKKLTIEINKSTVFLAVVFVVLGYFIGNTLPIVGGGQILGSTGTTIEVGSGDQGTPQEQPQQQAQAISLSPDDDPTVGDLNAPVQFYEFSDFQCPFCKRFVDASLGQLEEEYVDTGKVLFIYKDFPLEQIHPAANIAAQYANCAHDQDKWKEMHDAIFANQDILNLGSTGLDQLADQIGLDSTALSSCISSGKYADEISGDFLEGTSNGASGTPTFFIGNEEKGFVRIVGAQPYSVLKSAIDQFL